MTPSSWLLMVLLLSIEGRSSHHCRAGAGAASWTAYQRSSLNHEAGSGEAVHVQELGTREATFASGSRELESEQRRQCPLLSKLNMSLPTYRTSRLQTWDSNVIAGVFFSQKIWKRCTSQSLCSETFRQHRAAAHWNPWASPRTSAHLRKMRGPEACSDQN